MAHAITWEWQSTARPGRYVFPRFISQEPCVLWTHSPLFASFPSPDSLTPPHPQLPFSAQHKEMKACKHEFCTYDDYNWDWTLLYLSSRNCFNGGRGGFVAASVETGRVYHIGVCGMHVGRGRNGDNCSPDPIISCESIPTFVTRQWAREGELGLG